MYAYDAKEAFGSWCVKGAGADPVVPRLRALRSYSEAEEHLVDVLLRHTEGDLLDMLLEEDHPRLQRMIQQIYEYKRWLRADRG